MKLKYYPEYVRDMVDVDYAGKLGEKDKVWLAAFLEEYYRGWRLRRETQVCDLTTLREAGATHWRQMRGFDPALTQAANKDEGDGATENDVIASLDMRRRIVGR